MTRRDALIELRDKVKAGDDPGFSAWVNVFFRSAFNAIEAYNGSLDAAKALHEAVLPGWRMDALWQGGVMSRTQELWHCQIRSLGGHQAICTDERFGYESPARAWLLAILAALIAQADE